MSTITADRLEVRPVREFAEARGVWPRGARLAALRAAAEEFRGRFKEGPPVQGVHTFLIASVPYPTRYALAGAAVGPNPYVNLNNRMLVVRFEDFEGRPRVLVWEPTVPEGSAEAPFYAQIRRRFGRLGERLFTEYGHTVESALAECGLRPDDVDAASFDHLHVQDPRRILGTTEPVDGEGPLRPLFPNAALVAHRFELDTLRDPHPMQWAWYVQGGLDSVIEDHLLEVDGDVELGSGVALVRTPGHTDGNWSLAINTPDGVWVSSENGVCADSWQPELSKIPGVRRYAEFFRREVILNSNTLEDSIDQYDSMVVEKALADANRRDPRWLNIFPSSEMASNRRQWPVVPSFEHGGLHYGELRAPAARR